MNNPIITNSTLISDLKKHGKNIVFDKNNNPINAYNSNEKFYIILSGKIKVFNINIDTNREQTIYLLRKGDIFDVVVLLDGKNHDILTEVIEKGTAIELPINIVREWMKKNNEFKTYLIPYIANQIRQLEELSSDLSLLSTSERLTKLILKDLEESGELLKGLSNTEIGNLIGTVRQVVERHLKENQIIKRPN